MINNFDKNTLGNSPAAIYIIDLLNQIERKKAIYLIKAYGDFKETLRELIDAYNDGALSAKVVLKYIETYRSTLPQKKEALIIKGYEIKIINLYDNLLIAEFKKFIRKIETLKRIEVSAISRAKCNLKKSGTSYEDKQITTFGKFEGKEIPVEVKFNQYGLGSSFINTNLIEDKITSDTLMEKSIKRMERRKKKS